MGGGKVARWLLPRPGHQIFYIFSTKPKKTEKNEREKPDSNASYFAANMLHNTTFLAYSFGFDSPCVSVCGVAFCVLSLGGIHLHTHTHRHTHSQLPHWAQVRGKHIIKLESISRIKHFAWLLRLSSSPTTATAITPIATPYVCPAPPRHRQHWQQLSLAYYVYYK